MPKRPQSTSASRWLESQPASVTQPVPMNRLSISTRPSTPALRRGAVELIAAPLSSVSELVTVNGVFAAMASGSVSVVVTGSVMLIAPPEALTQGTIPASPEVLSSLFRPERVSTYSEGTRISSGGASPSPGIFGTSVTHLPKAQAFFADFPLMQVLLEFPR